MATLRQIAELASVSVATASRVLNGSAENHPVSANVQADVRAAAARLGYTASAPARTLRTRQSKLIGVIAGDLMDPYFAEISHGVEQAAAALGYATVVANANRDARQELGRFRVLMEHQASGIVFCGSEIDGAPGAGRLVEEVQNAVATGACVVALAPRTFDATRIVVDNSMVARELTRYVISLGHRHVAYVGGIPGLVASTERARGYRAAMAESGLQARLVGQEAMTQASGKQAAATMIRQGALPEAIVCPNDEVAIGVLAQLWRAGVRVPEDVSVAGIGGTRGGAVFDLTTMVLPLAELGARAAQFVAGTDRGADPPRPPEPAMRVGSTTASTRS